MKANLTVEAEWTAQLTVWANQTSAQGKLERTSWADLEEEFSHPRDMPSSGKDGLPLWSFATFENNYRRKAGHLRSSGIIIDYDSDPEAPMAQGNTMLSAEELRGCWGQYLFLAHTTPSHQPGKARWRVVLMLSRAVTSEEYRKIALWLTEYGKNNGACGLEKDTSWQNPAQPFYIPALTEHYEWLSNSDGEPLDVEAILASTPKPSAETAGALRSCSVEGTTAYGRKALEEEAGRIAESKEGSRHRQLYRGAVAIGELVEGGEIVEAEATEQLYLAAQKCNLVYDDGEGKVRQTIVDAFAKGSLSPRTSDGNKPKVIFRPGMMDTIVTEAEEALFRRPGGPFQRAGQIVEVRVERQPDGTRRSRIFQHTCHTLAALLSGTVKCVTLKNKEGKLVEVPTDPDPKVVRALLDNGEWRFPVLVGLQGTPTLREDGTVVAAPGYDHKTGIYLDIEPGEFPPIPSCPCREDALTALEVLDEVIADFPFATKVDRSVALAAILTTIGRLAVKGPVPLFLIVSHTPGTGKSLLVDAICVIATGRPAARLVLSKDEEMRKKVTSLLLAGAPMALIDNVAERLGGASLDAIVTAEEWGDRILGANEHVELPVRTVFFATGNNVQITGDLARRTALVSPSSASPCRGICGAGPVGALRH